MTKATNDNADIKLDYTITSPQQRTALVQKIIDSSPPEKLTNKYIEILSNYILYAMSKQEKKEKKINTDNRMVTINKREISFQGLISKFENGEDGIYSMITNDKNIILTPKISITEQDIATIPGLKELTAAIKQIEQSIKNAAGMRKYFLKRQLIQMRRDQYVLKTAYKKPIYCLNATHSFNTLSFFDDIEITDDGEIKDKSLISFMNPKHISALLCNYSKLKEECYGKFYIDGYYVMQDLDTLVDAALKDAYPMYYDLLIYKIDGKTNAEIQQLLQEKYNIKHSVEYLSSLWRNKIPKLIADYAEEDYLNWYFTYAAAGRWKKCTRCGEIKLAHNKYFSKNTSSRDGFYSICKCCRNEKSKKVNTGIKIIKRISFTGSKNENV